MRAHYNAVKAGHVVNVTGYAIDGTVKTIKMAAKPRQLFGAPGINIVSKDGADFDAAAIDLGMGQFVGRWSTGVIPERAPSPTHVPTPVMQQPVSYIGSAPSSPFYGVPTSAPRSASPRPSSIPVPNVPVSYIGSAPSSPYYGVPTSAPRSAKSLPAVGAA